MPYPKMTLAAGAWLLLSGVATAAPVVVDPNFNETDTSGPHYYGIAAWNAYGDVGVDASFVGNVGQDLYNQWNNGTPANGQAKVGFLSGTGSYIFQAIGGFTPGDIYTIHLLANARILDAMNVNSQPAGLKITTSASGTIYSGPLTPVDAPSTYAVPFRSIVSSPFTAMSNTVTVTLTNTGTTMSSLLVSGFTIEDIGHDASVAVPEPVSIAVLGVGLLGLAVARRRR